MDIVFVGVTFGFRLTAVLLEKLKQVVGGQSLLSLIIWANAVAHYTLYATGSKAKVG